MSYYTSIIIITWVTLGVLCILVRENDRLQADYKRLFYLAYLVAALAALAEWLGVQLSGEPEYPAMLLKLIKCADYILTPAAGAAIAAQLRSGSIFRKLMVAAILLNTGFQIVSVFTGWMLIVDEQNRYSHGPLYGAYVGLYLLIIVLIAIEFINYGRHFSKHNTASLYAILLTVIAGIAIQEFLGGEHRTAYITLAIGMALMYIHSTEFSQLAADKQIHEQLVQITTDALTGVASRHAYARALDSLSDAASVPEKLVAFSIDINDLKKANDTLGHEAGDELICGAAQCIVKAFGEWGTCYRTGGDEFIVIAEMDRALIPAAMDALYREAENWRGKKVKSLQVAAGSAAAADHPGITGEALVGIADKAMYAEKEAWYLKTGTDRRR